MPSQTLVPAELLPEAILPERGMRARDTAKLALVEVDPQAVVDGTVVDACFVADDVALAGKMREHCPYCGNVPLQLVLRYQHVIRSHLFCENCTRCFDAFYEDGSSALAFLGLSID